MLEAVAGGDFTRRLEVTTQDEIEWMGRALNRDLDRMRGAMRTMSQEAHGLAASYEELSAVSRQMSARAAETSQQTSVVSAAAQEDSVNVRTVATAATELVAVARRFLHRPRFAAERS